MYIPKHYEVKDRKIIDKFIKANSFGTIVSATDGSPLATHIPIELEKNEKDEKVLWGHISRANPQRKTFQASPHVLAIFLSPINHYISSSWYEYHDAPTWNYMSVHVTGALEIMEGEKLKESVRRLMRKYEKISENPVNLDDLPASVQKQLNGIVAFEIQIDKVEAAFKLSQNKDDETYDNIVNALRSIDDVTSNLMADILEKNR